MNKIFTTLSIILVIGTMVISCQKEDVANDTSIVVRDNIVYTVHYSVDGITYRLTLFGNEAWHDFVKHMIALAEEGHRVSFRNEKTSSLTASAKEVLTFTTTSSDEAYEWAEKKGREGYEVNIEFDDETGKYICTAIK
ncbi:MAG: hypothetical protein J6X58_02500 [Bacteroidales bacterium]|nr:hypothetical protein [Bacteroidales bacterium]